MYARRRRRREVPGPADRTRGRHLSSLEALVADDEDAHVVFVVQRPDVDRFRPYREVDPDFADLLGRVRATGVGVHAISTAFEPPNYRLRDDDLPIDLG